MPEIRIYSKKQRIPKDLSIIKIDDYPGLDPVNIGPLNLYKGWRSNNLHNAWEYSKVYKEYTSNGQPTQAYWDWASKGWDSDKPAKVSKKKYMYHVWDGAKYGIIEARKRIFASIYIKSIFDTKDYAELRNAVNNCNKTVAIVASQSLDYKKSSLTEALFSPDKEFGYAFLLVMMIAKDQSLMDIP